MVFCLLEQEDAIDLIAGDGKKYLETFWKFSLHHWAGSEQLLWEENVPVQGAVSHHSLVLRAEDICDWFEHFP